SDTETLDLENVAFTGGIAFTFPPSTLAPSERVVVVRDRAAFQQRYGESIRVAGEYGPTGGGRLDNGGERVKLDDASGSTIQVFDYRDDWYRSTDGEGRSLEIIDPTDVNLDAWNDARAWIASSIEGGTPGEGPSSPAVGAAARGSSDLNLAPGPVVDTHDTLLTYRSATTALDRGEQSVAGDPAGNLGSQRAWQRLVDLAFEAERDV
ncbi:MAG: hypothetical protein ACC645_07960, partial [Pirellulales bacterium]